MHLIQLNLTPPTRFPKVDQVTWEGQWELQSSADGRAIKPSHFLKGHVPPKILLVSLLWTSLLDSCTLTSVLDLLALNPCLVAASAPSCPASSLAPALFPPWTPVPWLLPTLSCPLTWFCLSPGMIHRIQADTQYWLGFWTYGVVDPQFLNPVSPYLGPTHDID